MTRQRKRQIALVSAGRCQDCGQKRGGSSAARCVPCLLKMREAARLKYRAMHDIPLDAPLRLSGRPRVA